MKKVFGTAILGFALLAGFNINNKAFAAPPDTFIDSSPRNYTTDITADFTFSSSDPSATFECSVDSGPFTPCTSPYTSVPLSVGQHTFSVRSTNLGNETDLSPATVTWEVVAFLSGDGSVGDPYMITNCGELQAIAEDLASSYELNNDINCDTYSFTPIGDNTTGFEGSFDGQGYKIHNVTYSGGDYSGIFGGIAGATPFTPATVSNLRIEDSSFSGGAHTGSLAGITGSVTITNIRVKNTTVSATGSRVGGIAGYLGGGSISTSSFEGTVTSTGDRVGGIVGYMVGPDSVGNSFSKVTIGGNTHVGGLVGYLDTGAGSSVTNSYSIANFTTSSGTRSGTVAFLASGTSEANNFSVNNLSGTMANGDAYKNTSSYSPLNTWDFGPGEAWHVNYNDYPSLTPIYGPAMLCEQPEQTPDTISVACDYVEQGWGTSTWEAEYQVDGASDWTYADIEDPREGRVTIPGTSAYLDYNVRLRFTNDYGTSAWALNVITSVDTDDDGSPDAIENFGPNDGDANNDNISDATQANVFSIISDVSDDYIVLSTPACVDNFNAQVGGESDESSDKNFDYPAGLLGFVGRNCGAPGSDVEVTIHFFGDYNLEDLELRKWRDDEYITIDDAVLEETSVGGPARKAIKATYTITDGGELDDDGVADGNIVDPVGLAVSTIQAPNTGLEQQTTYSYMVAVSIGLGICSVAIFRSKELN